MSGISKYEKTWLECYRVNAFTDKLFSGNPAGVVLDNVGLTDEEMQNIAREMSCSETAFIMQSDKEDYFKVRFFSPSGEVDLCGHATIASFFTLGEKGYISRRDKKIVVKQETKAGVLEVNIYHSGENVGRVMMKQKKPVFRKVKLDVNKISRALNIKPVEIIRDFPLEAVSTGLFSLPVCIKKLDVLLRLKPDFELIKKLCREINVGSLHVFSFETMEKKSTVHARNFAPLYGVNEDPVTGTANGALCSYLVKNHLVETTSFICEQGDAISRPGRVFVNITKKNNNVVENVYVGGKALIVQEGRIQVR